MTGGSNSGARPGANKGGGYFQPARFGATRRHAEVYGLYEKIYTVIDFAAAMTFVAGSVMFFYDALVFAGTWFFLVGSLLFGARPTVRLLREFHLARLPLPGDEAEGE